MQIVINIPETLFRCAVSNLSDGDKHFLLASIKNATVLEHHGRLIDADEIQFENSEFDTYGDYCRAFDAIDTAPTILEPTKM